MGVCGEGAGKGSEGVVVYAAGFGEVWNMREMVVLGWNEEACWDVAAARWEAVAKAYDAATKRSGARPEVGASGPR